MLPKDLKVKPNEQEAAQSGSILVQSELVFLLKLADMYHGITQ